MNIEEVQQRLWEQSRNHREHREAGTPLFPTNAYDGRARNLMDLMHNPAWLGAACERVLKRSRRKAPGVDGVTVARFQRNCDQRLEELRLELKRGTYQPRPLRRVEIPKANGKMRQLGIPCLRDKIVQEAIRMALEPIFEVEFHEDSYGFRPNRSTHHAVGRCRQLAHNGFTWVIEGDVKACFDEISHEAILGCVREKVMDNKFLDLLCRLLKAGVDVDGTVHPTLKGVPQGGVVSPLLANAVLNKLDWFLHSKGLHGQARQKAAKEGRPNIRFARYADDWCVFLTRSHKRHAEKLRDAIRDFLWETCGLRLSEEKTRITHVRDGYDFLGFHLQVGTGRSGQLVTKVRIGQKAISNLQLRLNEALRYRPSRESIVTRIQRASAVIRGWSNYFRIAHNFPTVASHFDHDSFWIATKAICRKEDLTTAQCLRKYRHGNTIGVHDRCKLAQFADTLAMPYYPGPDPYRPGASNYTTDDELEANFLAQEKRRCGSADIKWQALIRDGFYCRGCAVRVTARSSHADHIEPVHRFASFQQAHGLDKVQTLCHRCHRLKTGAET
jgi:group II intron reverse transcriptase/maturase